MASMDSPIPALQAAHFVPLNSRNIKNVEKIVYAEGIVFAKLKNGAIATTSERLMKNYYYTLRHWSNLPAVLKGMIYLGVITKKQAEDHKAAADLAQERINTFHDQKEWERLNKKYGKGVAPASTLKRRKRR